MLRRQSTLAWFEPNILNTWQNLPVVYRFMQRYTMFVHPCFSSAFPRHYGDVRYTRTHYGYVFYRSLLAECKLHGDTRQKQKQKDQKLSEEYRISMYDARQ